MKDELKREKLAAPVVEADKKEEIQPEAPSSAKSSEGEGADQLKKI